MNVQNQPPLPRAPHPRPALTQLVPPFAARPTADRVWLVAAHGGAGCTTIRMSARDRYADAGRGLPVSADPRLPSRVVLCAMCTGRGLEALRALLADWNAGLFGQTILMGVAVTMPLPKTPRELRRARFWSAPPRPRCGGCPSSADSTSTAFPKRIRARTPRCSRTSKRLAERHEKLVDAVHRRGAGDVRPWKAHQQRTSKEK
ncbi:MAG: hypothetical protein ACLUAM_01500 [Bifidobacterium adolescentis]